MPSEQDGVALRCLMGRTGPPGLGGNLASLLDLPEAVLDSYAEVLEANLGPAVDDRVDTLVKRYCRRHEVDPGQLAPSIKACRFLFTQTVKAGLDRSAFAEDVSALLPEVQANLVLGRLLPLFEESFPKLRQAAAFLSVAEHGRVVRAVRWRMDVIKSSDHCANLEVPVATITLQYQEGPNAGQTSFQLLPEQAAELKRALANMVD